MVRRIEPEPEDGPIDRDEQLGEAIEAYLVLAEGGGPPDPEAFVAGYPDLGEDLLAALEGLELVKGLVGGPGGPGHRLEEGRRVAGYRIVRELGRGGMGIVYEAVHVGLDRPVALKVLGGQAAPDSTGRRRFLNEAKTAAGLHHTHIVPVFDVGQVGGLCYYAMQRIEGSGLDRVLRHLRRDRAVAAGSTQGSASRRSAGTPAPRSGGVRVKPVPNGAAPGLGEETLSWAGVGGGVPPWRRGEPVDEPPPFTPPRGSAYYRWVADAGRQAAEALAHAHRAGVIHRDIKPSNLLVDARGAIWVADFGLARRLADPSQTQVDSLLGTPRYMSPEQARTGPIDGRADVYSLGATLYELITLRPPFDGQSAAELIGQITGTEPPPPRRFDPRAPLDLETILLKALAKRPEDRYASADDLADDLGRFLAHEPVRARRIGPVGRLWRFARRHPSVTAVTAAASTIVLTTAILSHIRVVQERNEAQHARDDAKKEQAKTVDALRQAQAERLTGLERHATAVLVSSAANRRSDGLDLLEQAARLGPGPGMLVKLRDLAVGFLSARDVQDRPPIAAAGPHGLTFAPGGRRVAALCDDHEVGSWGLAGGGRLEVAALPPPRGRGGSGQPKGRFTYGGAATRIASTGDRVAVIRPDGGGVRLYHAASLASGAVDLPMKGHDIIAIVGAPDSQSLVTLERTARAEPDEPRGRPAPEEFLAFLWDRDHADAPKAPLPLPPPTLDSFPFRRLPLLAVSPNGSTIAIARPGETKVALYDGQGQPLGPMIDVQVHSSALALGPAGLLAVAGGGEIVIWDLKARKPLPGLGRRQGWVHQLQFSPGDGSLLAAATGPAGGVELWDLNAHDLVAALSPREWVDDLAFSPDGRILAATQPTSIASWSIVEPLGQVQLPESAEPPVGLAFGPDDRLAIASREARTNGALRLWGGPGRYPPEVESWDRVRPGAVAFDALGRLATLDSHFLRWFRPPDPRPVAEVVVPDPRRGGALVPLVGSIRQAIAEADTPAGHGRGRGPSPRGDAPPTPTPGRSVDRSLARSRDGRTLAFLRSGEILIWRADEPATLAHLDPSGTREAPSPGRWIGNLVALAPDGSRLYHCGPGGHHLAAYTLRDPGIPRRPDWTAEVREAASLAIAPDGRTLAVGGRGGDLALIDTAGGHVRRPAMPPDDTASPVSSLAYAPDGRTLAVGSRDQVRLWAVAPDPRPLVRLPGHRGAAAALAFNARGDRLAVADEKATKVWDVHRLHDELQNLGLGW